MLPPTLEPLKSWSGFKRYLERQTEWQKLGLEEPIQALSAYTASGKISYVDLDGEMKMVERPSRSNFLSSPLSMLGNSKTIDGARLASSGKNARDALAEALLYQELAILQKFLVESEFPAKHGRKLASFSPRAIGGLGLAAAVGAMEVVARLAPLLVAAAREGYFLAPNTMGMQQWLLRLWCKVNDLDYPDIDYPRYDVAEGVLQMWDTRDVETLGAWLVQLCNLHTRLSASRQFMDFANVLSHFPVEVLLLFRLREQAGLANPDVDHPIMKFPWSLLWPIGPAKPDELLFNVYRRLEADEGITVSKLYQQLLSRC